MNVARIAPTWMTAVKAVIALSTTLSPSSCSVTVRCPVLDTGRNSVSPSTTPSTTAWTGFMRANLQRVRGNGATGGGGRAGRARLRPTPAGTPRTPHSRAGRRGATQAHRCCPGDGSARHADQERPAQPSERGRVDAGKGPGGRTHTDRHRHVHREPRDRGSLDAEGAAGRDGGAGPGDAGS